MPFKPKLTKKGIRLPKKIIKQQILDDIKEKLTVTPKVNLDYGAEALPFPMYRENEFALYYPRYFSQKNEYSIPKKMNGENININFLGKLRKLQQPIAKQCISKIKNLGGGIISLPCGYGKTILAIYIACQLKRKVLVIVHKTFLQDQWIERIKEFTNAKTGIIRQNKIEIEGNDIVIGMLQSISIKKYSSDTFKPFGLVIFDEVHRVGSRVFSRALFKAGARYTLGLSATPQRSDGLMKIIKWHLGDIIHKEDRKKNTSVVVKSINFKSNDKLFAEKSRYNPSRHKSVPDVQKMISSIEKIKSRTNLIILILNALRKIPNRQILILSGRLKLLYLLKDELDKLIKKDVDVKNIEEGEITTAYYIGKCTPKERILAAEADVIFATYAMAEEGLDIPGLNTLVLVTPKSSIIQSCGRILRKENYGENEFPLIIDVVDLLSLFTHQGRKRNKLYNEKKYLVDKMYFTDNIFTGYKPNSTLKDDISLDDMVKILSTKPPEPKKSDKEEVNVKGLSKKALSGSLFVEEEDDDYD